MIKVHKISIEEFRGIRKLELNFQGENYAICGPNGTGKSGIVDALEFGLTGGIKRLSGKGRGGLSVKAHGPHVNVKNNPEKSIVTLEIYIPSLGKKATISRNVKDPRNPKITPNDEEIVDIISVAERHPEFTLSRREIIKYILAEPGERAKEIQALLQLDELETTRQLLQKISNACSRDLLPLASTLSHCADSLKVALQISEIKSTTVLEVCNAKRLVLDLPPIEKLEATTSIKDGIESLKAQSVVAVPKVQALKDIAAADAVIGRFVDDESNNEISLATEALNKLKSDEGKLSGVTRDAMLKAALDLFDNSICPVCETPWKRQDFIKTVERQRTDLIKLSDTRKKTEALVIPITDRLRMAIQSIERLVLYAKNLPNPIETSPANNLLNHMRSNIKQLEDFLPIDNCISALRIDTQILEMYGKFIFELTQTVRALPEPSDRDAARDFLNIGQERLEAWRLAATRHHAAKKKASISEKVFETYGTTCNNALEAIYKEVEQQFRDYYRAINGDDEGAFEAKLSPSFGKLGFEVDFYGKGFFPPGAYHSEGHQDGMGLCLYLALMKYLAGDQFTFAVLDDVLMSVDTGHRREVCALLKSSFPSTQFVITTHDNVWLNNMRSSNLVGNKNTILFRKWHVDHGPSNWTDKDIWLEIDDNVSNNQISLAASQLRRYLEYISAEWSNQLGGRVEFRSDGKYELGDLLSAAIGALNNLFKKANEAANSWGNSTKMAEIKILKDKFTSAQKLTSVDQWQMNASIHYNEWANLQRQDFEPLVLAFKELETCFQCDACGDQIYVVRSGSDLESVRCACNTFNLNLVPKPKG